MLTMTLVKTFNKYADNKIIINMTIIFNGNMLFKELLIRGCTMYISKVKAEMYLTPQKDATFLIDTNECKHKHKLPTNSNNIINETIWKGHRKE